MEQPIKFFFPWRLRSYVPRYNARALSRTAIERLYVNLREMTEFLKGIAPQFTPITGTYQMEVCTFKRYNPVRVNCGDIRRCGGFPLYPTNQRVSRQILCLSKALEDAGIAPQSKMCDCFFMRRWGPVNGTFVILTPTKGWEMNDWIRRFVEEVPTNPQTVRLFNRVFDDDLRFIWNRKLRAELYKPGH